MRNNVAGRSSVATIDLKTEHTQQTHSRCQEMLLEAHDSVEQEQMNLSLLNEEIAELELQLEDYSGVHEQFGERTQLQAKVDELQSSVEQQQAVAHQAELNVQQAQSSAHYHNKPYQVMKNRFLKSSFNSSNLMSPYYY